MNDYFNSFNIKKCAICICVLLIFNGLSNAQDTTWVQGFNFNSTTRDSLITFPSGDHNAYEKILMEYTLRCKDGLVSTGSDRNKGCGEWDYSCNTNIIDSTGIDSLKSLHPNYVINGLTESYFYYTTKPTYTYYQYKQTGLNISSATGVNYFPVTSGNQTTPVSLNKNRALKTYFMIKASEIQGLNPGPIAGLQLNVLKTGKLNFLKIKIAATQESVLTTQLVRSLTFEEVLNRDFNFQSAGIKDLVFHKPFTWNGNQNIIVEASYTSDSLFLSDLIFSTGTFANNVSLYNSQTDSYIEFNSQSVVDLPSVGMADIKKEVTVTFWSKGNDAILPVNTSIFHAIDDKNNRQLNVHLPWSNGRIYWDCGNDGSGYDRIDKAALPAEYEGIWNHWAFTKNAVSGSMKIYLNGVLWHSGTGKTKPIDIRKFILGADNTLGVPYQGGIDDFAVWDKELSPDEIKSILYGAPTDVLALNTNMVAFYDFNEAAPTLIDKSKNGLSAMITGQPLWRFFRGNEVFKNFYFSNMRPDISLIKGTYTTTISNITVRDSIINSPTKITPYSISGSDLVAGLPLYYWASGIFPVYDESGKVVEEITVPEEDVIFIENLTYYSKFLSTYELLSFVTPYGIGLDLGIKGKKWTFDVTDFGPILKNRKRLQMDKGGQWQEDVDIKFAFIKGRPARNVISVQPIWPVTSYGYSSILNGTSLETRALFCEPEVKSMKVKVVTTGHGQEGEFIPRSHSLNVNGGLSEFQWNVWKECADNVIYPQGGTWVYDRAGWCPGKPSDQHDYEIMPFVTPNGSFTLDYGLNTASGDSRYIISSHLVKYGDANFNYDTELMDIIRPSKDIIHGRINPACSAPTVLIRNNGKNLLNKLDIYYGIEGKPLSKFTWSGSLPFLQEAEVILPDLPLSDWVGGSKFTAFTDKPNAADDEYTPNDRKYAAYIHATHLDGDIIVALKTNSMANETKWTLRDHEGNIVKTSKSDLQGYTLYQDTIKGLSGCYTLQFTDSDDDGISWWANGDGDGFIRVKGTNTGWTFFQPDFGKELTFNFTTGMISQIEDVVSAAQVNLFPNPTSGELYLSLLGMNGKTDVLIYNQLGICVTREIIPNTDPGLHQIAVDMSANSSGMYMVNVINNRVQRSFKFIKL